MPDATTTIAMLRDAVRHFNAQRHWEPFHSPKNLAMGLACEAAEIMEHFLWLDGAESRQIVQDPVKLAAVAEEVADVAVHLMNLTNALGLDLSDAMAAKMVKNAIKYPAPDAGGEAGVKLVLVSLVLAMVVSGQVPLPPPPDLPGPPGLSKPPPAGTGGPALPVPKETNPLPPDGPIRQEAMPPPGRVEGGKPPAFKLIDNNPQPAAEVPLPLPLLKQPPVAVADLPADGVVTPCLLLARSAPPSARVGQPFSYEIIVRNAGATTVAQARLEEDLPQGTRFLSAEPNPAVQGNRLLWIIDNLAPGAERRIQVDVEPGRNGDWQATATLNVSVSSAVNTSVSGAAQPPLLMTGPAGVPIGHPVAFQMRVTNTTGAALPDAVLRVQMTPGLQHPCGDAIEAALGTLAPAQTKEVTLEAIALQTGPLTAEATLLSAKRVVGNAQVTVVATVQPTLVLRQKGPLAPAVGGEVDFKLEVMNRSTAEVRELQVADVLPEGLQFMRGDNGAHYDAATRTIRWNIGTLPPGQARQMSFHGQVRGTGAQINRISARAAGVAEAQLYTILKLGGNP